mgnify:CR=1 FL=1
MPPWRHAARAPATVPCPLPDSARPESNAAPRYAPRAVVGGTSHAPVPRAAVAARIARRHGRRLHVHPAAAGHRLRDHRGARLVTVRLRTAGGALPAHQHAGPARLGLPGARRGRDHHASGHDRWRRLRAVHVGARDAPAGRALRAGDHTARLRAGRGAQGDAARALP